MTELRDEALVTVRETTGWQDIAKKPDAGRWLFFGATEHDHHVVFSGWKSVNGLFYTDAGRTCLPTHYMPLPPPPLEMKHD